MWHKILQRQLKKYLGDKADAASPEFLNLFAAISETYTHNDSDRLMIERSLEISSKEMMQKHKNIEQEKSKLQQQADQLATMNSLMVDRELKMVELKAENEKLKKLLDQTKI